jgi:hypothetical protein
MLESKTLVKSFRLLLLTFFKRSIHLEMADTLTWLSSNGLEESSRARPPKRDGFGPSRRTTESCLNVKSPLSTHSGL